MQNITKAIIPAAGLGTRFLPVTKSIPKEMLAIGAHPAIEFIVREAAESGITDVLIIVNDRKDCVKSYFSPDSITAALADQSRLEDLNRLINGVNISFISQNVMNGSGAAIQLARSFVKDEPFAVLFGDDVIINPGNPATLQLIKAFEQTGKCVIGCQERPDEEAIKYGVVKKGTHDGRLWDILDLVEKPAIEELPSNLCSLGRFILTPDIFDALDRAPMFRNEIYLTTAIQMLIGEKGVFAYDFEGDRYDLGDTFGFLQAHVEEALRGPLGDKVREYVKDLASRL